MIESCNWDFSFVYARVDPAERHNGQSHRREFQTFQKEHASNGDPVVFET